MTSDQERALQEASDVLRADASKAGKRGRAVRAVIYEGTYEDVRDVLSKSLPVGVKPLGSITITTAQGPIKVVE